jgi:hypothetical protein
VAVTDLKSTDQQHEDGTVTRAGKRYGCHLDVAIGIEPDGCVAMDECPSLCGFGHTESGRERRSRWTCQHWRAIRD